jgi:hypothetical protein
MQNSNVHFYIRINLEKSGSVRAEKVKFMAPFSARRESNLHYMHAAENLTGLYNQLSVRCTPSSANMPQEPGMRSTIEPMICFCLLALVSVQAGAHGQYRRAHLPCKLLKIGQLPK